MSLTLLIAILLIAAIVLFLLSAFGVASRVVVWHELALACITGAALVYLN